VFQNRTIYKVKKHKVPVLSLGKRDDKQKKAQRAFLEGKKDKNKLKLFFNSRSKEFPPISRGFLYNANVIEMSVFRKESPKANQFVKKV
jgi:hypothetical protein